MDLILPFKKGDFAESKSFIDGYKGAWFRCKINDMRVTETGNLEYFLEYLDYPDEEKTWTRVFEKNPAYVKRNSNAGRERRECMLRPSFPELYRGDQIPEQFPKSNVIVSVCDTPKVGDLGEWLSEGSYWTAKITKLLSEDMIKVQLLKPPIGEGGCYPAYCKDIRPALDWCLEKGWTVPLSQANGHCWYAARLIHHRSDMENSSSDEEATSDGDEEEVRKSLKRVSDTSQEAPGSSNLETTSDTTATSRLNSQTATIATTVGIPRPSPVSNSLGHSHGAQAAVTSQPGDKTCPIPLVSELNRTSNSNSLFYNLNWPPPQPGQLRAGCLWRKGPSRNTHAYTDVGVLGDTSALSQCFTPQQISSSTEE